MNSRILIFFTLQLTAAVTDFGVADVAFATESVVADAVDQG